MRDVVADPLEPAQVDLLVQSLPTASRLALTYAPRSARLPTLALLALDARLAGLLRHSREPMLAQLRLSWWRESLGRDHREWPSGEPLLAALRSWNGQHRALTVLVDGWEALTGAAPLPAEALQTMAQGRGDAFGALANVLDRGSEIDAARRLGIHWGLADLATRLGNPQERKTAVSLAKAMQGDRLRVSRSLRPVMVLQGLAQHRMTNGTQDGTISPAAVLKALRLGLLGF